MSRLESNTSFTSSGLNWKLIVLPLLIAGLCAYGWSIWNGYHRGLAPAVAAAQPEGEPRKGFERGRPEGERGARFTDLNLTPEQQTRLTALRELPRPETEAEWSARRTAMESIFTPEQQAQMTQGRESRRQQMRERARQELSPPDYAAFERRLEERAARGGGLGGPGGRRPAA